MRSPRRLLALLVTVAVLAGTSLAAAGCGATSHYLGAAIAHKVANSVARSTAARRRVNKVFCLYHGRRVLVDLKTHHVFAAGLNAIAAYRSCKAGFGRQR